MAHAVLIEMNTPIRLDKQQESKTQGEISPHLYKMCSRICLLQSPASTQTASDCLAHHAIVTSMITPLHRAIVTSMITPLHRAIVMSVITTLRHALLVEMT